MPDWMNYKPESRLPEEISIVSDMQMIPLLKSLLIEGKRGE